MAKRKINSNKRRNKFDGELMRTDEIRRREEYDITLLIIYS